MADRSELTDEWASRLMLVPTPSEYVTRPTRVLPLSISNLETHGNRNDFIRSKLVESILPDASNTKMTSAWHSIGGDGDGGGGDGVDGDGDGTGGVGDGDGSLGDGDGGDGDGVDGDGDGTGGVGDGDGSLGDGDGDGGLVDGDGPTTPFNVNITLPIVSSRKCMHSVV